MKDEISGVCQWVSKTKAGDRELTKIMPQKDCQNVIFAVLSKFVNI
jgi:hypothetical protein